jgi:hypothetical protein
MWGLKMNMPALTAEDSLRVTQLQTMVRDRRAARMRSAAIQPNDLLNCLGCLAITCEENPFCFTCTVDLLAPPPIDIAVVTGCFLLCCAAGAPGGPCDAACS